MKRVDCVVGSPPYIESPLQSGGDNIKHGRRRLKETGEWSRDLTDGIDKDYGQTDSNLGNLPPGDLAALLGPVTVGAEMTHDVWPKLYRVRYTKHDLVADSFQHPAKGCKGQAFKIAEHAVEMGWITAGSVVLDPFLGIGGFALPLLLKGCHVIGVELEPKHHATALQNLALWNRRYSGMPQWGTAEFLCGDSREVLRGGENGSIQPQASRENFPCITVYGSEDVPTGNCDASGGGRAFSTPLDGTLPNTTTEQQRREQQELQTRSLCGIRAIQAGQKEELREMRGGQAAGSPPQRQRQVQQFAGEPRNSLREMSRHASQTGMVEGKKGGETIQEVERPNRLERVSMPPGSVEAAIASPPYAEGLGHGGQPTRGGGRGDDTSLDAMQLGYGSHPANLARLREGSVESVVSSPPYEASVSSDGNGIDWAKAGRPDRLKESGRRMNPMSTGALKYSETDNNLGNQSGDTFWSASRVILENVFALLKPGGHAIFVCGAYVRAGVKVDFPDQWRQLCESVGFQCLHVHRCPKREVYGTQLTTEGEEKTEEVLRVSFFRRLAMNKNGLDVGYEDVLCFLRP